MSRPVTSPWHEPDKKTCASGNGCLRVGVVTISKLQHDAKNMRMTLILTAENPPQNHDVYCVEHGALFLSEIIRAVGAMQEAKEAQALADAE